jgi:hypothetical protein
VTVGPHAQQDQIELRKTCSSSHGENPLELGFVALRSQLWRELTPHAVDVFRRRRNAIQQRLPGHAVVAVEVVRRDAAFVAPEEAHTRPLHPSHVVGTSEQPVQRSWRAATRERKMEVSAGCDGSSCQSDHAIRRRSHQSAPIDEHGDRHAAPFFADSPRASLARSTRSAQCRHRAATEGLLLRRASTGMRDA